MYINILPYAHMLRSAVESLHDKCDLQLMEAVAEARHHVNEYLGVTWMLFPQYKLFFYPWSFQLL
jgi:hypothetical protein